jgi:hypothetical protein
MGEMEIERQQSLTNRRRRWTIVAALCSTTYLMRSHICGRGDGRQQMGKSLPLTLNGSEKGETKLSGWR